jgi:hypothetical protein
LFKHPSSLWAAKRDKLPIILFRTTSKVKVAKVLLENSAGRKPILILTAIST